MGSFVSQGWSAKNRLGNKVWAAPNVIWNSMKTQDYIDKSQIKTQYNLMLSFVHLVGHLLLMRPCLKLQKLVFRNVTF